MSTANSFCEKLGLILLQFQPLRFLPTQREELKVHMDFHFWRNQRGAAAKSSSAVPWPAFITCST